MSSDLFYYDESSPTCLRWKVDVYNSLDRKTAKGNVGEVAGTAIGQSAYRVGVDGDYVLCHHIVWELHNGSIPSDMFIDHFDRDEHNNKIGNLRCVTRAINNRNKGMYQTNKSGVTGVQLVHGNWLARWYEVNGKRKQKSFAVSKYGNDEAFRLACEYRAKMIEELNAQGAGYTKRHGN